MKDVMASLPEVIKEYKGYNLLIPTATDVQLNPFYKFHIEEVAVDLSETSGDIFKVSPIDSGRKDNKGNKIYVDAFSLSKPLLNKLAMAAGIQFNPEKTYGERIDRVTYRAHAQGAMRKADGFYRTETDQREICLEDEEEKYRIEFSDKSVRGITDEKQAKAAAEIFKGTWTKSKNKWGKMVDAYVIDEAEREKYIERSVMVNMAQLKKTWAEKAMTGAKLRVIRALLGIKSTYTYEELKRILLYRQWYFLQIIQTLLCGRQCWLRESTQLITCLAHRLFLLEKWSLPLKTPLTLMIMKITQPSEVMFLMRTMDFQKKSPRTWKKQRHTKEKRFKIRNLNMCVMNAGRLSKRMYMDIL